MKSKKAAESFSSCVEKYNRVGGDFEQKMCESAQVRGGGCRQGPIRGGWRCGALQGGEELAGTGRKASRLKSCIYELLS